MIPNHPPDQTAEDEKDADAFPRPGTPRTLEDYRALFEANQAVMLMVDPERGMIFDANPAAAHFYGYSIETLRQMPISAINCLSPEEISQRIAEAKAKTRNYFLFRHRLSSGEIRDVEVFSSPIRFEGKTLLFSIIHDVTEKVVAERSLRESEALLRSIFESTPDLLLLIDRDLRIVLSNWKGRDFVPLEERAGLPHCHKVFMGRERPCEPCYAMEVFASGKPLIYERYNPNPKVGHIEVHAYPIFGADGKVAMAVEHVRDINERKRAEREKAELEARLEEVRRLESIGTLAGGIAHDFNNLLMAIMGNVSIMQMEAAGRPELEQGLKRIEECVRRGADLTRQILGFARGGKYVVEAIDLNRVVSDCLSLFSPTRKDISTVLRKGEDLVIVDADKGQLDQVFLNIFINAGQAMPKGGELTIDIGREEIHEAAARRLDIKPGLYCSVSITDTGIGIEEKNLPHIFEPFFTTKPVGQGTGLGLASAYGILRNHGGMITVQSQVGVGSTFTVYLPEGSERPVREKPLMEAATLEGITVLVVDDEAMIRETASAMLAYSGAKVLEAEGGESAIRLYSENKDKIDVIILDMVMPNMRGGETFKRLKAINPTVKVILSSGYSMNREAEEIMSCGCIGFLQKPFGRNELTAIVKETIGK
jgi:PAS domain S-box-containing protein